MHHDIFTIWGGEEMNRKYHIGWIAIVGIALSLVVSSVTGEQAKEKKHRDISSVLTTQPSKSHGKVLRVADNPPSKKTKPGVPNYKPPMRGAPGGRVGGGTRSPNQDLPVVDVLAPDHLGLTGQAQPVLFWYISEPTELPAELTIIDEEGVEPLIEAPLPSPKIPGVQRLPLGDYDFQLQKDKEYRWFVSLVVDRGRRSKDIIAGGRIEHVDFPGVVNQGNDQMDPLRATSIYAEKGFWYDAVEAISKHIEANPTNLELRGIRAALLDQVDLLEIAKVDRGNNPNDRPTGTILTQPAEG